MLFSNTLGRINLNSHADITHRTLLRSNPHPRSTPGSLTLLRPGSLRKNSLDKTATAISITESEKGLSQTER